MRNYYTPPIDPGYGAIGQALGGGLQAGAQNFAAGRENQQQNAIRQAMMAQQQAEAQAQQGYRQQQLGISQEQLGLAQQRGVRQGAEGGFFPGQDLAQTAMTAAGMEGEPMQIGNEWHGPGYGEAMRAKYRPQQQQGQSQGSIIDALADTVRNEVTGGGGRPLHSENDYPAAFAAASRLSEATGVSSTAILRALWGPHGRQRDEPREPREQNPMEIRQKASVRAAQAALSQFEVANPPMIFNPSSPDSQVNRWNTWLTTRGGQTAIARAAAEAGAEAGIELSVDEVRALMERFIQIQEQEQGQQQSQAPELQQTGGGWRAVLQALRGGEN